MCGNFCIAVHVVTSEVSSMKKHVDSGPRTVIGSSFRRGFSCIAQRRRAQFISFASTAVLSAVLAFRLPSAEATQIPENLMSGMIGMYIFEMWPYNYPYSARTWTIDDWRGYVGGLQKLGYNTILIHPLVEIMPQPLTS